MPSTPEVPLLEAVLGYAARAWPVFPCHTPTESGCSCQQACGTRRGKHPRTPHGLKDATTDAATIHRWWCQWPMATIGLVAGSVSGEAINTTQCLPPLPAEEVRRITSSCLRYPAGPTAPTAADQPESSPRIRATTVPTTPYSDVSNAEALVAAHGRNLRYCYAWGRWLIWSGTHWRIDDTGEIMRCARDTLKTLVAKALDAEDRPLVQHLTRSHTHGRLTAMCKQAQSMDTIPLLPAACDTDPWLLNCRNGTLDLRSGSLRPHCRADLLTRCLTVAYVPEARCPTWERFLWRVLGGIIPPAGTDTGGIPHAPATEADARASRLVRFLQRAVGYTLTGVTSEDCLFLLYGRGRNGKSRFLEALHALLGPYAKTASMRTFLVQNHDTVRNDLADLYGVRYGSTSEVQEGQRFSEGLVKQLTGGDRIKARFLFQEYFEFVPQFKLFLACNHKPIVRGTDLAIWERIKLVPFTVTIPPEERDTDLGTKLRAELEGIFAWAVRGCLAWQQAGRNRFRYLSIARRGEGNVALERLAVSQLAASASRHLPRETPALFGLL